MEQIQVANFTTEEFLEFTYIAGLHKSAKTFSKALGLDREMNDIIEKYEYKQEEEENEKLNKELEKVRRLCKLDHLKLLRNITKNMAADSKILEVGSYLGATTLALLQGARLSNSRVTSIDVHTGIHDAKIKTERCDQSMHWEHLEWQNNVSDYADIITSYHGCAVPILRDFVRQRMKFDLIFVDTAHDIESIAELTLISCLASENCLIILDDVVDYNNEMTTAWLMSLKYNFGFPKFFDSSYAIARLKNTSMPMNFKVNTKDVYKKITEIARYLDKEIEGGRNVTVTIMEPEKNGFFINISEKP